MHRSSQAKQYSVCPPFTEINSASMFYHIYPSVSIHIDIFRKYISKKLTVYVHREISLSKPSQKIPRDTARRGGKHCFWFGAEPTSYLTAARRFAASRTANSSPAKKESFRITSARKFFFCFFAARGFLPNPAPVPPVLPIII